MESCSRTESRLFVLLCLLVVVKSSPPMGAYEDIHDSGDDNFDRPSDATSASDLFRVALYYGIGGVPAEPNWKTTNHQQAPLGLENQIETEKFQRKTRKHARPMFYLNCSLRSQCYCYSKPSRHHYCCSCEVGACFPGNALVSTPSGSSIPMRRLRTGDKVLTASPDGQIISTEILGFLDRRPFEEANYVTLITAKGHNLTLSGNHLLFKANLTKSVPSAVFAQDVAVGDSLYLMENGSLIKSTIQEVVYRLAEGAFVPLTKEGTLLVNGFLASCYASFPHDLSHSFFAPIRSFPNILRLRSFKKPIGSEDRIDVAESEGYGEPFYVSLVKRIGNAFFSSQRAQSDILQIKTTPDQSIMWLPPAGTATGACIRAASLLLELPLSIFN